MREPELAQEQALVLVQVLVQALELVQEQVREQAQAQELALVRVRVLEQEQEQVQVQALELAQVQELVRASVDAYRPAPKQDRARAAVITPRHGTCAFGPGRSTSHQTMPVTLRIRSTKS